MLSRSRSLPAASIKALAGLAASLHGPAPVRQETEIVPWNELPLHHSLSCFINPSISYCHSKLRVISIAPVLLFFFQNDRSPSNPLLIITALPHSFLSSFFSLWFSSVMWRKTELGEYPEIHTPLPATK